MFNYFSLPQSEKEEFVKQFEKRYERKGIDECWLWDGNTIYGRFVYKNNYFLAHRVAWMLQYNTNIPAGLHCCHRCDEPSCVNGAHIFLGTQRTNIVDMMLKDRSNFKKKLVERLEISRLILEERMTFEEIRKKFNCWPGSTHLILKSKEVIAKYGKVDLTHRLGTKRETWPKIVPLNQLPATQPRRQT